MKKIYFLITLLVSIFFAGSVFAVEPVYPIADLGNCKDKNECMVFCNDSANISACIDYGEKNGMISAEEAKLSKKVAEKIKEGKMPGNCKNKDECEKYCQGNITTLEECLDLVKEVGISSPDIEEGKKVLEALKAGAQMPGDCKNKNECESYCADTEHIDECLTFAEKAQLISPEELAEAKKVAPFLKSGNTPGKCKTKDDCNKYCEDSDHADECISFAETAGFISKEEAEMARKAGGSGPGGCKSTEECNEYCEDESHLEECIDFGVKVGAIKEKDVQKIKEGASSIKSGLGQIPEGARSFAESCLNDIFGGKLQDVLDGKKQITESQGNKVGPCFESAVSNFVKNQMSGASAAASLSGGQNSPGAVQGPPCSSAEECAKMFGPK